MSDEHATTALAPVVVEPLQPALFDDLDGQLQIVYTRRFLAPVAKLNTTLDDILDLDAHPDRSPDEALRLVKAAMDEFHHETTVWFPDTETESAIR